MADDGLSWRANSVGGAMALATRAVTRGLVDVRITGHRHIRRMAAEGRSMILTGWHGHNFATICAYEAHLRPLFRDTAILVPDSEPGRVLQAFGREMGFTVVRVADGFGASDWGRATLGVIRNLRKGGSVLLFSPDGPAGPAEQVKPGIALIARRAGAVIIPGSAATRGGIRLRNRWDEHILPLPFSRLLVHFGPPIDTAPPSGDAPTEEEVRSRLQAALERGERIAEARLDGGRDPDPTPGA